MSTENLREEAEAARRTLGQLARRAAARRREVQKELEGLATETDHVLTGARGALRAIEDDREVVLEELGQLDEILSPSPSISPTPPAHTENVDEEDEDDTVIVEPMPSTPIQTPVHLANDEDDDDADVVIEHHWYTIRTWSGIQWLAALIGLLIGVVIAANTWSNLVSDISGFGRGCIASIWFFGLMGFGFFGGGLIGSFFDRD